MPTREQRQWCTGRTPAVLRMVCWGCNHRQSTGVASVFVSGIFFSTPPPSSHCATPWLHASSEVLPGLLFLYYKWILLNWFACHLNSCCYDRRYTRTEGLSDMHLLYNCTERKHAFSSLQGFTQMLFLLLLFKFYIVIWLDYKRLNYWINIMMCMSTFSKEEFCLFLLIKDEIVVLISPCRSDRVSLCRGPLTVSNNRFFLSQECFSPAVKQGRGK